MARPELDRLRDSARRGEVARLYVFRLDRLTRTGIRDTLALIDELEQHGCEVVSIGDGFDLHGPAREVVLSVLAWVAKMERAALGERISAARDRAEAQGKSWGRPRRADDELAEKARILKSNGKSERQIAVALKVPRATLQRALAQKGAYGPRPNGAQKARLAKA